MGASDLFGAYYEYSRNKEDLLDFLISYKFPVGSIDNHRFDPYDSSLELDFVPNEWAPDQFQLEALSEYGFLKLYVNYEDGASARSYYSLPEDKWGRVTNSQPKE